MGKPITEKELEKYDYLRAEYFKKNRSWPYTPRPLTNYEKAVMEGCGLYSPSDKEQTYADIPLANLYLIEDSIKSPSSDTLKSLVSINDGLMSSKEKNFSKNEVEHILSNLYKVYDGFVKSSGSAAKIIGVVRDESKSILGYLDGSEYYKKNKSDLAEKKLRRKYDESKNKDSLKDFYLNPGDIKFLCSTVLKSIPQNIEDEIKSRKTYLSNKKSRDYSDFMAMRKKIIALCESGKVPPKEKEDELRKYENELLKYYAGSGYEALNGVARHSFKVQRPLDLGGKDAAVSSIVGLNGDTKIIDEDFFMQTVLELDTLRKRLEKSTKDTNVKWLYRGMTLYKLLKRIPSSKMPVNWNNKKFFEEDLYDSVSTYLIGKVMVDPGALSTSLSVDIAQAVAKEKEPGATGVVLVIDVSRYHKGQKMMEYSDPDEQEILLPPGVKLKIKSVTFKKDGSDGYFEVNCVPV